MSHNFKVQHKDALWFSKQHIPHELTNLQPLHVTPQSHPVSCSNHSPVLSKLRHRQTLHF